MNEKNDICDEIFVHEDTVSQVKQAMPKDETLFSLAELFKNFSDTTRIKILYALLKNELCVCDIATVLNISQSATSHQLRVLKASHLVRSRRQGKSVFYALADEHITTILQTGMDHVAE